MPDTVGFKQQAGSERSWVRMVPQASLLLGEGAAWGGGRRSVLSLRGPQSAGDADITGTRWENSTESTGGGNSRAHENPYSFIHFFNNYLLSSYYVPGTVLGSGDVAMNKTDKTVASWSSHSGR